MSPEQSVPQAAGGVQHCALLMMVPVESLGGTSPDGQLQVLISQPSFQPEWYSPSFGQGFVGVQQVCELPHSMPLPQPALQVTVLPEHVDGGELPEHCPVGQVGFAQHIAPSMSPVGSSGVLGKRLQSQTLAASPQPGLNAGWYSPSFGHAAGVQQLLL
jgi:hypothetical protein